MTIPVLLKYSSRYHLLALFCLICNWLHTADCLSLPRRYSDRSRIPCGDPGPLANGFSRAKRRNLLLQHYCNYGYLLIGERRTQCIKGKWYGDRPICAKAGCVNSLERPENGRIQLIDQYRVGVYCSEGYDLAGNRYAYCNGTTWDRTLGSCRQHSSKVSHDCDFETEDICGWVVDTSEGFKWRRAMAANVFTSFQTGPRHDHTTMSASGGHYMLMESYGVTATPVALTSPIYGREMSLMTACCFQFYYFMYGAGVGNLNVYVKPVSKTLLDIFDDKDIYVKFSKSGNQNNNWNEAHFSIDEMEDDFQIIFVADGAKTHLSDIAIDDVKILTGAECKLLNNHDNEPDDSSEIEPTTTVESLYDTQSCVSRCGQLTNGGIMRQESRLIGLCSCHDTCILDEDCCPDYVTVCLLDATNSDSDDQTSTNEPLPSEGTPNSTITTITSTKITTTSITPTKSTTSTTPPKTTTPTTTTTTTRKSTTTARTTPRSTPRTILRNMTTTTTTTTRKPTTTTTRKITTTTTTTQKPAPTTTTTTCTTTPTTTTTTTTKRTTSTTRITTPTTISTRTTPRATTTTKLSKNPATRSTPFTTSTIAAVVYTEPISDVTTVKSNRSKNMNEDHIKPAQKEKNRAHKNYTKHTWEWQPKPEGHSRESTALLVLFGFCLTVIIVGTIYRQRETLKSIWLAKLRQKDQNDTGAEDSSSIIANFRREETQDGSTGANGSTTGNRMKFSLPSLRKGRQMNGKTKRISADEQTLGSDNENDDIPLL